MALRSVKTSHATTNMAICILAEISTIAMHSTIQMKPYKAAIIQYNAWNYIMLIKYQENIHTLRAHYYALIEWSAICA